MEIYLWFCYKFIYIDLMAFIIMSKILKELTRDALEDDAARITHTPTSLAEAAGICVTAHQSIRKEAGNFSFPEHTPLGFSEKTNQNFGKNMQSHEGCKQQSKLFDDLIDNPDTNLHQSQRNRP